MSRSYRRPYSSVCGNCSARQDKTRAARGVRRKQDAWLKTQWYEEEMGVVPHKLECDWNEIYSWTRDGGQYFRVPSAHDWNNHLEALECTRNDSYGRWMKECYGTWPPRWFQRLLRK